MVEAILVLSTAHIPYTELDEDTVGVHRFVPHEFGWVVFIPLETDPQEIADILLQTAEWLQPIYKYALAKGCSYINFDADGDIINELPVFLDEDAPTEEEDIPNDVTEYLEQIEE